LIFAVRGKQDRVAEFIAPAQPQSIMQTFHRLRLTDIDVVILWRSDGWRIAAFLHQPRERQGLIAILLVNAEEVQWRAEQFVDRDLNIGAHMARKLARPCHELATRNSGKVPIKRDAGVSELLSRHFLGREPDGEQAGAAKAARLAREQDIGPRRQRAA